MTASIEWIGFAGIALSVTAYLPQIIHLIRENCSTGLSPGAYFIWVMSTLMLLAYAVSDKDPIFISLQSYQLTATAIILYYSLKYRRRCKGKASGIEVKGNPLLALERVPGGSPDYVRSDSTPRVSGHRRRRRTFLPANVSASPPR